VIFKYFIYYKTLGLLLKNQNSNCFLLQLVNIKLLVQQCQLIMLAILVNIQACSSIMSAYYACDSSLYIAKYIIYIASLLLNKGK
jgi:hypothetical protein